MRTLEEVLYCIQMQPQRPEFIMVDADAYEDVRDEAIEFCEEHNEPFASSPQLLTPHFLILGIPVLAAGHA